MTEQRQVRLSKYLSRILRHAPDSVGLTLEPGGWVAVDALLAACRSEGKSLSRAELDTLVAQSDKQRFALDPTGTKIRANQGHSVAVDLQLAPVAPPATLYHGTGRQSVAGILEGGLQKMRRHHVHLSPDPETAIRVGARHGKPVVLTVDAAGMHAAGHVFYRSENGVWLTDQVPPAFLSLPDETSR